MNYPNNNNNSKGKRKAQNVRSSNNMPRKRRRKRSKKQFDILNGGINLMPVYALGGAVASSFVSKQAEKFLKDEKARAGAIAGAGYFLPMLSKDAKIKTILSGLGTGMFVTGGISLLTQFEVLQKIGLGDDMLVVDVDGLNDDDLPILSDDDLPILSDDDDDDDDDDMGAVYDDDDDDEMGDDDLPVLSDDDDVLNDDEMDSMLMY